jgi:hypothetical protein
MGNSSVKNKKSKGVFYSKTAPLKKYRRNLISSKKRTEEIEILKTIANVHRDHFNQRRKYDIQVILATLGVDAYFVAAILSRTIDLSQVPWLSTFISVFLILLSTVASIYLYRLFKANAINKSLAKIAEDELIKLSSSKDLNDELTKIKNTNDRKVDWLFYCQLFFIWIFTLPSAMMICLLNRNILFFFVKSIIRNIFHFW